MTFVINERTCSTSGLPVRNCGCGGHRQQNDDNQPAGGSLANNSALWGPDTSYQRAETKGSISIPHSGMVTNDRLPAGGSLADVSAAIFGR